MKVAVGLIVLFCSVLILCEIKPEDSFENVQEITDTNFNTFIGKDKNVILEVYAPWCGYCRAFAPKMKKLGELIAKSKRSKTVLAAKLNGDKFEDLANKFNVQGFPTLFLFKKGSDKPIEYQGNLSVKEIFDFLHKEIDGK